LKIFRFASIRCDPDHQILPPSMKSFLRHRLIFRLLAGWWLPLLFAANPARVFAATWYLDKAATGANNGMSAIDAWTTVASVDLKKIQAGDTLLIQGGDYSSEELLLQPAQGRKNITFRIDPATTKQAVFKGIELYAANVCTIDGLLPGSAKGHYSTSIQMFRTVGTNTIQSGARKLRANSVLVRESTGATIRGIECDQSALKVGLDDDGRQQHGIAINGHVYNLVVEYNYVHDTIGDGLNYNYRGQSPTGFTNIITRYNYVHRVGDDCMQSSGGNLDIYGNLFDQGGVPIYYGGHPDAIQINPFGSYVKIHENVLADTGQQPFVEKAQGEIYIYNNLILCLRTAAIGGKPPGQPGGPAISTADGNSKQAGYQGPSFGNFIFANNLLFNAVASGAFKGAWRSNGTNNVIFTGNVFINVRLGAPAKEQYMCEETSLWWDLPGVVWYESKGNVTRLYSPRNFGTAQHKDPGLVDPENLDFRPASANSPLIGLSRNLTEFGITTDFDGNPRPATGNWTAGPYEWTGRAIGNGLQNVPDPRKK
jgi:hypothetical protein